MPNRRSDEPEFALFSRADLLDAAQNRISWRVIVAWTVLMLAVGSFWGALLTALVKAV